MTNKIKIYIVLGIVSLTIAAYFGYEYVDRLSDLPERADQKIDLSLIGDWMTISYLSKEYHVPEKILLQNINVDSNIASNNSISSIAKQTNKNPKDLIQVITQNIKSFQGNNVPSTGRVLK